MKNSIVLPVLLLSFSLLFSACKDTSVSPSDQSSYSPGLGSTYTFSGTEIKSGIESSYGPYSERVIATNASRFGMNGLTVIEDRTNNGDIDTIGLQYQSNGDLMVISDMFSELYPYSKIGLTRDTVVNGTDYVRITTTEISNSEYSINGKTLATKRQKITSITSGENESVGVQVMEYAPAIGFIVTNSESYQSKSSNRSSDLRLTSYTLK